LLELLKVLSGFYWSIGCTQLWLWYTGLNLVIVVDYEEPATNAPFHIESDDLKMIDNNERLDVSCDSSTVKLTHYNFERAVYRYCYAVTLYDMQNFRQL